MASGSRWKRRCDALSLTASGRREQPPFFRHALERARAAVFEPQSGAGHEVLDGARHEHFANASLRRNARTDVYGYAADLGAHDFAFAGVDSCPHLKAELVALGTDSFDAARDPRRGRCPEARWIAVLALKSLADAGQLPMQCVEQAMATYGLP